MLLAAGTVTLALAGSLWALRPPGPDRCPPSGGGPPGALTPYPVPASPERFVQGATLDATGLDGPEMVATLRRMRDEYHVNTVNVYGLEHWDASGGRLDRLFTALRDLDLRLALRVEAYDPATFAFSPQDVARVVAAHRTLLAHAAAPGNRERVTHIMLNMPVDDPAVQQRLGGVNSATSRTRQVTYAADLVAAVRAATGLPVYVGLFYGWDGSYDIPSYSAAGADGYVLTNYSYPDPPDRLRAAGDAPSALINEPRLRTIADRAVRMSGDTPIVVEYGFHTLTYQHGNMPDQVAGLVADRNAKEKALRATTELYCRRYPTVIGTIYFGYNTLTTEGTPPRRLDFALL
ncbi:hypothetical protein Aab01nite_81760 [Paractinoplanes abujensis]|nr:hypothetical protein Aab01nite_81760 [Actinoplanes abujensis]